MNRARLLTSILLISFASVAYAGTSETWTPGEYAQFRIAEEQGGKKVDATMWRVVEQVGEKGAVILQVIQAGAQPVGAPPKLDTPGLRGGRIPVPGKKTPSFLPEIPKSVVVKDGEGKEDVALPKGRTYACQTLSCTIIGTANDQEMSIMVTRWMSDDAPLGGLVKLEERFVKPQPGSRTTTLVGVGKIAITPPRQQLLAAAEATMRGDANGKDPAVMSLFLQQYLPIAMNVGAYDRVPKLMSEVGSNVPTAWIRQQLMQQAVRVGQPAMAQTICETEPMWQDVAFSMSLGAMIDAGKLEDAVLYYKAASAKATAADASVMQNALGQVLNGLAKQGDLARYRELSRVAPTVIYFELEVIKLANQKQDPWSLQEAMKRIDAALAAMASDELRANALPEVLRGYKATGVNTDATAARLKDAFKLWADRTKEPPYWVRGALTALAIAGEHEFVRKQLDQLPEASRWFTTSIVEDLARDGWIGPPIEYIDNPPKGYTPASQAMIAIAESHAKLGNVEPAKLWARRAVAAEVMELAAAAVERKALEAKHGANAWQYERVRIGPKTWEDACTLYIRLSQFEDARQLYVASADRNDVLARPLAEIIDFAGRRGQVGEVRKAIAAAPKARRREFTIAAVSYLASGNYIEQARSLVDQVDSPVADRLILEAILAEQVARDWRTAASATLAELQQQASFKDVPATTLILAALHCTREKDDARAAEFLAGIKWLPVSSMRWVTIGADGYEAELLNTNMKLRPDLPESAKYPPTLGDMLTQIGRERGSHVKFAETDGPAFGQWLAKIPNAAVRAFVMAGASETVPAK